MKFLTIFNEDKTRHVPEIQLSANDFDTIFFDRRARRSFLASIYYDSDKGMPNCDELDWTADLTPCCWQERPLIEAGGICEFDVVMSNVGSEEAPSMVADSEGFFYFNGQDFQMELVEGGQYSYELRNPGRRHSLGSIFTDENKLRFPQLYKKALEIIYND